MAQIAANLQRIKNGQRRYAITPRIPGGFIQPEQLQKYIDVAYEFGAVLKLTASQRIMITNLKAEDVDKAWEMLGMEPAYTVSNRVRSVKICLVLHSVNVLNKIAYILACKSSANICLKKCQTK